MAEKTLLEKTYNIHLHKNIFSNFIEFKNYLTGITSWNYFSDCLTKTSTVFKDNANIFGKVYFPRLIMPLSIVVSNLVRFGVQLLLLLLMMGYFFLFPVAGTSFQVTYAIAFFPFLVLLMALLGLGLGLIITAITTKYKDLTFLITFGVSLLMYGTTVIYPLSAAPEKYKRIIELNPMTGIIEAFRFFRKRRIFGLEPRIFHTNYRNCIVFRNSNFQ